ncbi:hypothetical protein SAMN05660657_03279 [Geodermatophilus amargosae]|uniref:Poly(3-hydroxyalkanoate) polymerase subunit PhaE n=1 Tax=Geodermatophilus amargosae TaxID=1296565 RepID=A0A1I7B508_9ACTN|nr:hypothetical protein [Geodermatophilus amargosae]SFT82238.1 hypothetical protein SAMN05660657_03279 [Geodermatophilus amargosae]
MGLPGPRDLYDRFEEVATPLADELIRSKEFAQAVAFLAGADRTVRAGLGRLAARAWHAVNLPAGTDVKRLRQQVGALDRDLRLLSLQLQRDRREETRRGDDPGPEPA